MAIDPAVSSVLLVLVGSATTVVGNAVIESFKSKREATQFNKQTEIEKEKWEREQKAIKEKWIMEQDLAGQEREREAKLSKESRIYQERHETSAKLAEIYRELLSNLALLEVTSNNVEMSFGSEKYMETVQEINKGISSTLSIMPSLRNREGFKESYELFLQSPRGYSAQLREKIQATSSIFLQKL